MSSLVLSIPSAPAASSSNASAAASSSARGRDAQSPTDAEGGFGAALARSRDARTRQADDKAESASDAHPARRRGPASATQREEASPAELLAMAMLTPAFSAQSLQQQRTAAQGGEGGALSFVEDAATATGDEALASTKASASAGDARAPAQAAAAADTAATQAAQANAAEQDGKDARNAKAKADALPSSDAKPPTTAAPAAAAAQVPGTDATATSNAANASPAGTATAAKPAADITALPLQSPRDAAQADHASDAPSDASTQLPGAFTFKAALAEAANAALPAPAQPVPRFTVPTPVGAEGWGADIGTQMIRMGADGHHVAELSLNPAGLGPLKVTLTLGDNQAQALFVSAHESVRRALEAALPQLRDTLAGQGIQLGQASVDAGAQQQQQAFNQERSFDAPVRPGQRSQPNAGPAVDTAPALAASRSHSASGIDTFA